MVLVLLTLVKSATEPIGIVTRVPYECPAGLRNVSLLTHDSIRSRDVIITANLRLGVSLGGKRWWLRHHGRGDRPVQGGAAVGEDVVVRAHPLVPGLGKVA